MSNSGEEIRGDVGDEPHSSSRDDLRELLRDESKMDEIVRLAKDEMNLVEHPFGSLSKEKDTRTIELVWKARHPASGKILNAQWKVMGTPELGLPTANDEKVYLVAMELTREQEWPRQVHFTRRDFLRRLGWSDNDESYRRLFDALARLSTVSIQTKNAFYHPRSGHYIDGVFHLIERFVIAGEGPGRKRRAYSGEPPTFLVWSEALHQSFIAGNIRSVDLDFALSLERPLSLRLFRYLDKKRHGGRRTFEIALRELCGVHLGMVTDGRYDSNFRASLDPAHAELIQRGFLDEAAYEKMKTRKGLKVVYTFTSPLSAPAAEDASAAGLDQLQLLGPAGLPTLFSSAGMGPTGIGPTGMGPTGMGPAVVGSAQEPVANTPPSSSPRQAPLELPFDSPENPPPVESSAGDSTPPETDSMEPDASASDALAGGLPETLPEALAKLGVSPSVAQELCASFDAAQIQLQLDCLHDRSPQNPAATVVKAIRQAWNPPPKYLARQRNAQKAPGRVQTPGGISDIVQGANGSQKGVERKRRASEEEDARRTDVLWGKLDPASRDRLDALARQRLGILGQAGRAPAALQAMRRTLLRETLSHDTNTSPEILENKI
jgi:hypothetical protein